MYTEKDVACLYDRLFRLYQTSNAEEKAALFCVEHTMNMLVVCMKFKTYENDQELGRETQTATGPVCSVAWFPYSRSGRPGLLVIFFETIGATGTTLTRLWFPYNRPGQPLRVCGFDIIDRVAGRAFVWWES